MSRLFLRNQTMHKTASLIVCVAILLIVTSVFSVRAQQDIEADSSTKSKTLPTAQIQNSVNDLNYLLPSEKLSVLPISINGQQIDVPIIKYGARQAVVKGTTILIGEMQAQGQVDSTLYALAKLLPDWGWHTILITPRQSYLALDTEQATTALATTTDNIEAQTPNETISSNSYADESMQTLSPQIDLPSNSHQVPFLEYTHSDYLVFLSALTQAINTRFSQQPGYQIIYAKGTSASALVSLFGQLDTPQIDALIVNNAFWPSTELNRLLPKQLANLPMPVLDFVSLSDNSWAKQTADARAIASKVNLKTLYRQREIIGGDLGPNQHNYLAKEVVSWTYFLGW